MSLSDSNTYASPESVKSISLARSDWNNSMRAVLQNFRSTSAPAAANINLQGTLTAPPNGMLFSSATNGRLYLADSVFNRSNPVYGGNWTRIGIAHTIEDSLASADFTTYEQGELFGTVGANTRLYMKSDTGSTIVDIGIPPTNSIVNTMLKAQSVTQDKVTADIAKTFGHTTFTSNTQTTLGTVAVAVKSFSGDARLGFNAASETGVMLAHVRGSNSISVYHSDGTTLANVVANTLIADNVYVLGSHVITDLDVGNAVQGYDAAILKSDTTANLAVGYTSDVEDLGNSGTSTLAPSLTTPSIKTLTITGSFTLNPPASGSGRCTILATNDGTGGYTITTSGFSKVLGTYESTASSKNLFEITKINSFSMLVITDAT